MRTHQAKAGRRDALHTYRAKRDFAVTAEPRGGAGKASPERRFVVQRHDATRLHFDLRLELDGVYKSWAVTKVPSPDPAVKRLAVEVEDHPLDYGTFEGTIPEGQYGGGTVQLWDRGHWTPQASDDPARDLKDGHIAFVLDGERMRGGWALIRMRDRDRRQPGRKQRHNWLLIKEKDAAAQPGREQALAKEVTSVDTGRTLEQIAGEQPARRNKPKARARRRAHASPGRARSAVLPDFIPPQLCRLTDAPPTGEAWVHEIKFDGYRMQLRVQDGKTRLRTRKGLDWTARFPEIAAAGRQLPDCLIDGEICALDMDGRTDFGRLQTALTDHRTADLVFFAFDCLFAAGEDLRDASLADRKTRLQALLRRHAARKRCLRFVPHVESPGREVLAAACGMQLEGVVSKRRDASYRSGRGDSWTKSKCRGGQEVVIGGWRGNATTLRSLLVGTYQDGKLVYMGRVGTGYGAAVAKDLLRRLQPLTRSTPPFANPPRDRDLHWVTPKLVGEIEFENVTSDGLLRQAAFKGLRLDKTAKSVVREQPKRVRAAEEDADLAVQQRGNSRRKGTTAEVLGIRITHPDKPLWPATKATAEVTKLDLARYYAAAAERMLTHIAGRPISVVRAPDGIAGEQFFQRHALLGAAARMRQIRVKGEAKPFFGIDDAAALVALAQAGVVEIHPWGSAPGAPDLPERIILDLDPPPEVPFAGVVAAAKAARERLETCGLVPFVKTTGGKGLHVVVAIKGTARRQPSWPEAKAFAKAIAVAMERDAPGQYTTTLSKQARTGKIFIDYLRNDRTSTGVAPWSPRARAGATIALPLDWGQVRSGLDPAKFTIAAAGALLKRDDPWQTLAASAEPLEAAARRLAKQG